MVALHTLQPQRDKRSRLSIIQKKTARFGSCLLDAGLSEAAIFMNRFFVSKKAPCQNMLT